MGDVNICARCHAGIRAGYPCSVCGNEDHMLPPPDDAPQTGQRPPWDLDTIHEIQAIVYQYHDLIQERVPEHIETQIDDFIAMGLAHALPDATLGLTPPEPKEGGAS